MLRSFGWSFSSWSSFFFDDFAASGFDFGTVSEFMFAVRSWGLGAISSNNENVFAFDRYFSTVFQGNFFNFNWSNSFSFYFSCWSSMFFSSLRAERYNRENANSGECEQFVHRESLQYFYLGCDENMRLS